MADETGTPANSIQCSRFDALTLEIVGLSNEVRDLRNLPCIHAESADEVAAQSPHARRPADCSAHNSKGVARPLTATECHSLGSLGAVDTCAVSMRCVAAHACCVCAAPR
eukprot:6194623-Pleurochrysis_carterae.AAC.4